MAKSDVDRKRNERARRKTKQGLVRLELWTRPEHREAIKTEAERLNNQLGDKNENQV